MSTKKVIPGLEDAMADTPSDVEVTPPLASAAAFTGTVTPKQIQPAQPRRSLSQSQKLTRMPTSRAEILAKQNRAIAKIKGPSTKITTTEWIAYRIDQYISTRKGQTASLSILGLLLMTFGGIFLKGVRPSTAFRETVWEAWTYLADAGTHTALVDEGLRVVGVLMSLTGILYFSVIMGFVVDGIRAKMDTLKKGKSNVAEQKHTICLANASESGGVVVVLAEIDKEELEAELESQMRKEELRGTRVIFRTGTPLLSVDLLKVSAHRARSIIIMANSSGDADRSDAAILRTVLSLKTLPELSGHIVAELRDIDNDPLLRLVGGNDVEILVSHDVIGRLVLMSARSPGLARVYSALLGFEGNEFYFKAWPECVGVAFGGLAECFPNATPLGLKRESGEVFICPSATMIVEEGDEILVLAEDDDTYKACPPVYIDVGTAPVPPQKLSTQERILMCGWRRDIRDMIQLLDAVVQPGTELHMICEEPIKLRNKSLLDSGLDISTLKNLKLVHHLGNTAIRRQLEKLPWDSFTSIMILSDQSRETDIMHSDSHSLASLLLIRDLQAQYIRRINGPNAVPEYCKCISEILDPRTQRTISTSATILKLSEFIQSNELVSCILAMISESRDVRVILDELLGPQGAYFEVEPSSRYCDLFEKVSFWQLAK
ncbi:Ion channel, partial [Phytophthora palmivora]